MKLLVDQFKAMRNDKGTVLRRIQGWYGSVRITGVEYFDSGSVRESVLLYAIQCNPGVDAVAARE
jgi:hypothetical protein